jgi:hypothetical protein
VIGSKKGRETPRKPVGRPAGSKNKPIEAKPKPEKAEPAKRTK